MSESVKRLQCYLAARKKIKQFDPARIHWINQGEDSQAELRSEDIEDLLKQRDELLEALQFAKKELIELHNESGEYEYVNYAIIDDAIAIAEK